MYGKQFARHRQGLAPDPLPLVKGCASALQS